jgi:hypothetical protein
MAHERIDFLLHIRRPDVHKVQYYDAADRDRALFPREFEPPLPR